MRFFRFGVVLLFSSVVSFASASPLETLAKKISTGADSLSNKKIAVLALPYHDGKTSSGSSIVSERLTTLLVNKRGIKVIERRLIEDLMKEKKLSQTGLLNPSDMKTVGSLLDVDAVVTGTLIDFEDNQTEINARMIRIDTGQILAAGRVTIERTWSDIPVDPPQPKVSRPMRRSHVSQPKTEPLVSLPEYPLSKNEIHLSNRNLPPGRQFYRRPKLKEEDGPVVDPSAPKKELERGDSEDSNGGDSESVEARRMKEEKEQREKDFEKRVKEAFNSKTTFSYDAPLFDTHLPEHRPSRPGD